MPSLYSVARAIWRALPGRLTRWAPVAALRSSIRNLALRSRTFHDLYDRSYFLQIERDGGASYRVMAESLVRRFGARSVLDVGCGSGALLARLRELRVAGRGLEYARAGLRLCRQRGLDVRAFDLETDDLSAVERCDLVASMEVAEHLSPAAAGRYVELLCRPGAPVVFTAARPGQGGASHVNEQPAAYWIREFRRHGFSLDRPLAEAMQDDWRESGVAPWFCENLMVFRPPSSRPADPSPAGGSDA